MKAKYTSKNVKLYVNCPNAMYNCCFDFMLLPFQRSLILRQIYKKERSKFAFLFCYKKRDGGYQEPKNMLFEENGKKLKHSSFH